MTLNACHLTSRSFDNQSSTSSRSAVTSPVTKADDDYSTMSTPPFRPIENEFNESSLMSELMAADENGVSFSAPSRNKSSASVVEEMLNYCLNNRNKLIKLINLLTSAFSNDNNINISVKLCIEQYKLKSPQIRGVWGSDVPNNFDNRVQHNDNISFPINGYVFAPLAIFLEGFVSRSHCLHFVLFKFFFKYCKY